MPNLAKLKLKNKAGFKFDLKTKQLLILVACVIVILIWYVSLSNYHSGKTTSIQQQTSFLKASYVSKYQLLVNLEQSAKLADEEQKSIMDMQSKLLPIDPSDNAIDEITTIGNEEQLKFIYFKPQSPIKQDNMEISPINISLTGKYQDMIDFLDKLAKLDRTVAPSEFVLMRRGQDGSDVILNVKLDVYTGLKAKNQLENKQSKK